MPVYPLFHLCDARGIKVEVPASQCALARGHDGMVFARTKQDPYILLRCMSLQMTRQTESIIPATWEALQSFIQSTGLPTFFTSERFSLYRIGKDQQLQFVRNVPLSPSLLPWIQKAKGTYVYFTEETIGACYIRELGNMFVSPIAEGLPISHLKPGQAWW